MLALALWLIERSAPQAAPGRSQASRRASMAGMRLRIELFVDDLDTSIGFYAALGFAVERREHDYASLRWGDAVIGLGPIAKLPPDGAGPGFTQERLAGVRGAGVEIVLEVEDLDAALAAVRAAGHPLAEPPQDRPWGLRDFRLADPDGYYLRITTSAPDRADPRRGRRRGVPRRARPPDGTPSAPSGSRPRGAATMKRQPPASNRDVSHVFGV